MCKHDEPIKLFELEKLQEFYRVLIEMAGEICEFKDKHTFSESMTKSLENLSNNLSNTAHELVNDIFKMKKKNENNEGFKEKRNKENL